MLPPDAFEWDEARRRSNLTRHGLDFVAARRIFEGPLLLRQDGRRSYGKDRFQAIGAVEGRIVLVVFTRRGAACRIISARIANREERTGYQTTIGQVR